MSKVSARAETRRAQRTADEKPKGLLHYLGMGISAGLFGLVVLVGALVIVIPMIANAQPLTVLTSSMEPSLPPGTLVVVKPIDVNEIQMGDIITYQIKSGEPGVVTHRVVAITNSSDGSRTFTLKGDNNDVADELQVIPVQIQGKLWYSIPWLGNVASFVNGDGRSWLTPVIAVGLFIYAGFMITTGLMASARKRRRTRERAERHDARAASIEAARAEDDVQPSRDPSQTH